MICFYRFEASIPKRTAADDSLNASWNDTTKAKTRRQFLANHQCMLEEENAQSAPALTFSFFLDGLAP